jgi:hypothetical protein
MAAETVDAGHDAGTEEGAGRSNGLKRIQGRHSGGAFRRGRVDPCRRWFGGRNWRLFDKALRIFKERAA